MTQLTTPTLVMVLVFCKDEANGSLQKHLVSLPADDPTTVRLWQTTPLEGESLEEAALRCLREMVWHEDAKDIISQPQTLWEVGDSLSDNYRIKLYRLGCILPRKLVKTDGVALVRILNDDEEPGEHSLFEMDSDGAAALQEAPAPLKRMLGTNIMLDGSYQLHS